MAEIVTLTFTGLADQAAAARQSIEALIGVCAADGVRDHVDSASLRRLSDLYESGDLFGAKPVDLSARGAVKLESIKLLPSDSYGELVTAIADQVDGYVVRIVHGWPILSVEACDGATVAEGEGAASALPGGPAA